MKRLLYSFVLLLGVIGVTIAQQSYSLDDLLSSARDHSTQSKIDSLEITIAQRRQKQARAAFFPKGDISTSYFSLLSSIQFIDTEDFSKELLSKWSSLLLESQVTTALKEKIESLSRVDLQNSWFLNLGIVQPLFTGGKIFASNKLTNYAIEVEQWKAKRRRAEETFAIEKAYYTLVSLYEKEKILTQYRQMIQQIEQDIEQLTATGYTSKRDLLAINMAILKVEQSIDHLKMALPLASQNLACLAFLTKKNNIVPADDTKSLALKIENITCIAPDKKICEGTKTPLSRQKLLQLNRLIQQQQTRIQQSEMLPQIAVFANYSALYPNFFHAMKKEIGGSWSFGLTVKIPLSSIYTGYQAQKEGKAKELIAQLEEKETLQKLQIEREKAHDELIFAKKTYKTSLRLKENIEKQLELALLGYKEGEISIEQLLQVESNWLEIDEKYITDLTNLFIQEASIRLVLQ